LMPSFCWPLGLGPKPAITRPLTGQRNNGVASVGLTAAVTGVGNSRVGVTTDACCTGGSVVICLGAGGAFGVWVASGWPALPTVFDVRVPGMAMRSPILSVACGSMLLALAISGIDLP